MVSTAVVIPVRNGAGQLHDCVASILRQTRPPDEILIAIAPSTDDSRRVAQEVAGQTTRVLDNPAGDRGSGLNIALASTEARTIAMVDAQSRLEPDYLERALAALDSVGVDVAGGPMRAVGRNPIGRALALALASPFGIGDSQFHFGSAAREADSVYLGVYRRRVFERIGRYNTALLRTEDDDLNARAREAGFRIWLDPSIRSTYLCRNDLPAIWRQYLGYGFWKVALGTVRAGALRPRHALPAAFVLGLAAAAVVSWLLWWPALPLVISIYLVAAWSASLAVAGPLSAKLLFPAVTLTMHVAYGVGTLAAVMVLPRLARRARDGARAAAAVGARS